MIKLNLCLVGLILHLCGPSEDENGNAGASGCSLLLLVLAVLSLGS